MLVLYMEPNWNQLDSCHSDTRVIF